MKLLLKRWFKQFQPGVANPALVREVDVGCRHGQHCHVRINIRSELENRYLSSLATSNCGAAQQPGEHQLTNHTRIFTAWTVPEPRHSTGLSIFGAGSSPGHCKP